MEENEILLIESELDLSDLKRMLDIFPPDQIETVEINHIDGGSFISCISLLIPTAVIVRAIRDIILEKIKSRSAVEKDSKIVRIHYKDLYYEGAASNLPLILGSILGDRKDAE